MRIGVVLHRLGPFLIGLGLAMCAPLLVSFLYKEADFTPFVISAGLTIGTGAVLRFLIRPHESSLSRREALLLVPAVWMMAGIIGALPYLFSGALKSFPDAFFESMSGFTTTGASVMATVEDKTHGILLWRSLTHWLGGIGIIVLIVAIFPTLGVGAANAVENELTGPKTERLTARIRDTARILWQIFVGLSVLELIALLLAGMSFFHALLYTLTTIPSGGFAPHDMSIGSFHSLPIEIIVTIFMVLAGINFQLFYFLLWKKQLNVLFADRELRGYLGFLAGASILIAADLVIQSGSSIGQAIRASVFQVVSIQTTTGFATVDYNPWPAFSQIILLVLMFVGASASSTGGGVKVMRVIILFKYMYRQLHFAFSPRAIYPMKLGAKTVPERVVSEAIGVLLLYSTLLVAGFLIIVAIGGLDPLSSLFAVASVQGNVGPALGPAGSMGNYSTVTDAGKVVLALLMFIGRLEVLAVLVLFTPAFWRARGKSVAQAQSRLPAWRS